MLARSGDICMQNQALSTHPLTHHSFPFLPLSPHMNNKEELEREKKGEEEKEETEKKKKKIKRMLGQHHHLKVKVDISIFIW